jgi:hypothetical protein
MTGQTERADLGADEAAIRLPALEAQVSWQQGFIQGRGPANTPFVLRPALPCAQQQQPNVLNVQVFIGPPMQTGPDGSFQAPVGPFGGGPGAGIEIGFYDETDHRFFRQAYRPLARVFIRTDRVTGRTNPLAPVSLVLSAADGSERARATVTASPTGGFSASLVDATGEAVASNAGDTLRCETAGEAVTVPVEALSFDWSPGGGAVQGNAPANREVELLLRLQDGRVLSTPRQTDAGGRFSFAASDVPPRGGWTMADVEAIRLVLTTANGHQIIDQTADFEGGPGPSGPRPIYLPIASSNRRAAAAAQALPVAPAEARRRLGPAALPRWQPIQRPPAR